MENERKCNAFHESNRTFRMTGDRAFRRPPVAMTFAPFGFSDIDTRQFSDLPLPSTARTTRYVPHFHERPGIKCAQFQWVRHSQNQVQQLKRTTWLEAMIRSLHKHSLRGVNCTSAGEKSWMTDDRASTNRGLKTGVGLMTESVRLVSPVKPWGRLWSGRWNRSTGNPHSSGRHVPSEPVDGGRDS
jgi:hypothetical protein